MSILVLIVCFLSGLAVSVLRGAGVALALVYLPALVLLSRVTPFHLPVLSLIEAPGAALYGILAGALATGRWPRFRPTLVDALFALLLLTHLFSTLQTESLRISLGVLFGTGYKQGVFAYFAARAWLRSPVAAERMIAVLPVLMGITLFFSLIELRLWPHTYGILLDRAGLAPIVDLGTLHRFGLFRAQSVFWHPIDLGNAAALAGAVYAMVVWQSGRKLTTTGRGSRRGSFLPTRLVLLGGWFLASLCAISFTSLMGVAVAVAIYAALYLSSLSRRLLPLLIVVIIAGGFVTAHRLATTPVLPKDGDTLERSLRNRQELLRESWDAAAEAGALGWGALVTRKATRSVDNAYLLAAMARGWIGLGLWLALPLALARMVSRCRGSARGDPAVRLVMLGAAAVIGTMVAMFTVFFGFSYPQLLMIVFALTVNGVQALQARQAAERRAQRAT